MSDTLSLSGEVIVAASLILIGLLIGAQILGIEIPLAGYVLVAAAVLVVTGIILMIYTLVADGRIRV